MSKDPKSGVTIVRSSLAPTTGSCKSCGKEKRQDGSSRGIKCANLYKVQRLNARKLEQRIQEARNIKLATHA